MNVTKQLKEERTRRGGGAPRTPAGSNPRGRGRGRGGASSASTSSAAGGCGKANKGKGRCKGKPNRGKKSVLMAVDDEDINMDDGDDICNLALIDAELDRNPLMEAFEELNAAESLKEYGFNSHQGVQWIYPTNRPIRDYQFDMVNTALFHNTLVSLPTGLGKTFISAVVMYNFARWYPSKLVIFMAPTRHLVTQQLDACQNTVGIHPDDTVELTGQISIQKRAQLWRDKKVFFLTPQVMLSDLEKNSFKVEDVRCIVVDEAHKALGNHAYAVVINRIAEKNKLFRVLALSATPGNDLSYVEQVFKNLLISRVELRSEDSPDILPYIHEKTKEVRVVRLDGLIREVQNRITEIFQEYSGRLMTAGALFSRGGSVPQFQLLKARESFRRNLAGTLPSYKKTSIENDFCIAISLSHAIEILYTHGICTFYKYILAILDKNKANPLVTSELKRNEPLQELLADIRRRLRIPDDISFLNTSNMNKSNLYSKPGGEESFVDFDVTGNANNAQNFDYTLSHPKLAVLKEIIESHFEEYRTRNATTRAIIFSQYRDSCLEIEQMLNSLQPMVKPMMFIGKSSTRGSGQGLKGKGQLKVVEQFREGSINVLVATCVGEEGLDIGEVDLIVCFDASKSPTRLIQRMGRTGRQRSGRTIFIVTSGKEEQSYNSSIYQHSNISRTITDPRTLEPLLYRVSPRMVPSGLNPVCFKMPIMLSVEQKSASRKPSLESNQEDNMDIILSDSDNDNESRPGPSEKKRKPKSTSKNKLTKGAKDRSLTTMFKKMKEKDSHQIQVQAPVPSPEIINRDQMDEDIPAIIFNDVNEVIYKGKCEKGNDYNSDFFNAPTSPKNCPVSLVPRPRPRLEHDDEEFPFDSSSTDFTNFSEEEGSSKFFPSSPVPPQFRQKPPPDQIKSAVRIRTLFLRLVQQASSNVVRTPSPSPTSSYDDDVDEFPATPPEQLACTTSTNPYLARLQKVQLNFQKSQILPPPPQTLIIQDSDVSTSTTKYEEKNQVLPTALNRVTSFTSNYNPDQDDVMMEIAQETTKKESLATPKPLTFKNVSTTKALEGKPKPKFKFKKNNSSQRNSNSLNVEYSTASLASSCSNDDQEEKDPAVGEEIKVFQPMLELEPEPVFNKPFSMPMKDFAKVASPTQLAEHLKDKIKLKDYSQQQQSQVQRKPITQERPIPSRGTFLNSFEDKEPEKRPIFKAQVQPWSEPSCSFLSKSKPHAEQTSSSFKSPQQSSPNPLQNKGSHYQTRSIPPEGRKILSMLMQGGTIASSDEDGGNDFKSPPTRFSKLSNQPWSEPPSSFLSKSKPHAEQTSSSFMSPQQSSPNPLQNKGSHYQTRSIPPEGRKILSMLMQGRMFSTSDEDDEDDFKLPPTPFSKPSTSTPAASTKLKPKPSYFSRPANNTIAIGSSSSSEDENEDSDFKPSTSKATLKRLRRSTSSSGGFGQPHADADRPVHKKPKFKKKSKSPRKFPRPPSNPFIMSQAVESDDDEEGGYVVHDEDSSDEEGHGARDEDMDKFDSSFVDEESIYVTESQQAMYLQDLRDRPPRFGRVERPLSPKNYHLPDDLDESYDKDDSFCAADDEVEYADVGVYTQAMNQARVDLACGSGSSVGLQTRRGKKALLSGTSSTSTTATSSKASQQKQGKKKRRRIVVMDDSTTSEESGKSDNDKDDYIDDEEFKKYCFQ